MEKVIVGMSGGIDSSVTAYILQKDGYEVEGVYLKLHNRTDGYHESNLREPLIINYQEHFSNLSRNFS